MIRSSIAPFFALFMLAGCDGPKSSLGELPVDTTGTETTDASATADGSGSITVTGEQSSQDIGLPCQLNEVPEAHLLEIENAGCGSGMCLYADTITAAPHQGCTEDSECTGFGQGVICGATGQCELDPAHIAARSRCTDTCVDDAECVGADGTTCEGGFACMPVQAFGPVCCERVCVCRDELDVAATAELASECEAGLTPGCCDQQTVPEACGG
jgi:hypothetical protein